MYIKRIRLSHQKQKQFKQIICRTHPLINQRSTEAQKTKRDMTNKTQLQENNTTEKNKTQKTRNKKQNTKMQANRRPGKILFANQ